MTDEAKKNVTQEEHPWRATIRTVFQLLVGFAPVFPAIVAATDLSEASPWVGLGLVISSAVTRIMAQPQVNDFLDKFFPWLSADPKQPSVYSKSSGS